MATPVEMPQLGNTVEACVLTRWVKGEGDAVRAGDIVAEIETDKTTFEVAAPADGTILATFFDEGAIVPVFTTLFVVGTPGERIETFRPSTAKQAGTAGGTAGRSHPEPRPPGPGRSSANGGDRHAPMREPARHDPQTAVQEFRVSDQTTSAYASAFSPRASRLAAELGVRPADIKGSGPGGRVLERDVRRARATAGAPRAIEQGARPAAGSRRAPGLRTTIARRMRESLASTAQYTLHGSADATGLLALRARIKARASDGTPDITIHDLVAFCTIQALLDLPMLNAEYINGEVVEHADVHLAFAVDTPRGLLAPVVRRAHDLSIGELSLRMKELTAQALHGTILPDDLAGATFTMSNLGSLGVESFTPVINPPQVAILGVDAISLRPVRRGMAKAVRLRETSARRAAAIAESIDFVDTIGLSLTCDHQAVDGAPGARFLQVVGRKIAAVETLVEL